MKRNCYGVTRIFFNSFLLPSPLTVMVEIPLFAAPFFKAIVDEALFSRRKNHDTQKQNAQFL
jgi:hypothetical protein